MFKKKMMMKSGLWTLMIVGLTAFLSGCHQPSPLEKLASDKVYGDLTDAYWSQEAKANTALWQDAVKYCKAHSAKPNCPNVMMTMLFHNTSSDVPAYGTSGHHLTLPHEPRAY